MKILILGGSGQLGQSLLSLDWNPHELRFPTSSKLDITDIADTRDYISSFNPDVVVNATAWTNVPAAEISPQKAFELNATAVGHLATICKESDAILIHVSTDYVFDGKNSTPYSEDHETYPLNAYGESKLAGEKEILASGLERYYILRTSWLYSRFGRNFVKTIVSKALNNETSSITDDQFGSPTFAGDLASGIASLINSSAKFGIYNYSNSGITSWFEFGKSIYQLAGADQSLVSPRKTVQHELKRPPYSPLDLTKWSDAQLSEIRNWKEALITELPSIIVEVERLEI